MRWVGYLIDNIQYIHALVSDGSGDDDANERTVIGLLTYEHFH